MDIFIFLSLLTTNILLYRFMQIYISRDEFELDKFRLTKDKKNG